MMMMKYNLLNWNIRQFWHKHNYMDPIKYKQNIVKHNSINDFMKLYSYIVTFNNMFQL